LTQSSADQAAGERGARDEALHGCLLIAGLAGTHQCEPTRVEVMRCLRRASPASRSSSDLPAAADIAQMTANLPRRAVRPSNSAATWWAHNGCQMAHGGTGLLSWLRPRSMPAQPGPSCGIREPGEGIPLTLGRYVVNPSGVFGEPRISVKMATLYCVLLSVIGRFPVRRHLLVLGRCQAAGPALARRSNLIRAPGG